MGCPGGGIGRRTTLRWVRLRSWGFESPLGHHKRKACTPVRLSTTTPAACRMRAAAEGFRRDAEPEQWPLARSVAERSKRAGRIPADPAVPFRCHRHRHRPDRDRQPARPHPAVGGEALPVRMRLRRSEEHTSELQSLMRISYAVFCLKKKKKMTNIT